MPGSANTPGLWADIGSEADTPRFVAPTGSIVFSATISLSYCASLDDTA
jgi:hypothetical protein